MRVAVAVERQRWSGRGNLTASWLLIMLLLGVTVLEQTAIEAVPLTPSSSTGSRVVNEANRVATTACPNVAFDVKTEFSDGHLPKVQIQLAQPPAVHDRKKPQAEEDRIIFGTMITGKDRLHEFLAEKSASAFAAQDFARKVLIVVNDSPDYSITHYDIPCVVEIFVEPKKYSLGKLRNIAINAVPVGTFLVQWDDDDWHAPSYLSMQLADLYKKDADVSIVSKQTRFFVLLNSSYIYTPLLVNVVVDPGPSSRSALHPRFPRAVDRGIEGSVLAFKSPQYAHVKYPDKAKGEDSTYLSNVRRAGLRVTPWSNPFWAYFRLYHGANTWSGQHYGIHHIKGEGIWCHIFHGPDDVERGCTDPVLLDYHYTISKTYAPWKSIFDQVDRERRHAEILNSTG
ncbi:uncharacterized protein MONBRDRAFT_10800 [Monosiga brevicollis MX1]|uniref:Glycosyltransferase 2-like domain-containing protein n=1 Tax=Monosiga brevicollis TaxID=81824 RepID=A9V7A0_MONBE|nr:uncharacterized protein MONBRDRAFT_10800 [Monosiga brevicollis MX1]EDQ86480.1 predicted protein [Monosiga brevicollis MX1]|eukprot:XP_001748593.1 hypothetical protein [Monosiga brevicollis MX1]